MNSVMKLIPLFLLTILGSCKEQVEISERLKAKTFNYPVLKEKNDNPILRIRLDSEKEGETVKTIQLNIGNTKPENLKNILVYYTEKDSLFNEKVVYGASAKIQKSSLINGNQNLHKGTN